MACDDCYRALKYLGEIWPPFDPPICPQACGSPFNPPTRVRVNTRWTGFTCLDKGMRTDNTQVSHYKYQACPARYSLFHSEARCCRALTGNTTMGSL